MDCEALVRYLSEYIDQNLDRALEDDARAHLSTCHNCRVVLDSTQQTIRLYRAHGQRQTIPAERGEKLFRALAAALARYTDPDSPSAG